MSDELKRAYDDMLMAKRRGGVAYNQARLHYKKLLKKEGRKHDKEAGK